MGNDQAELELLPPKLDPTGRISFSNLISFSDFLEKNIDKPLEEMDLFAEEFVSLRERKVLLAESNPELFRVFEGDVEEDSIIVDEFTASLVNEKRELMIDGRVVRYTAFGTWVYHDDFTARVEELLPTMTDAQMEKIYANHDFEADPFYELEPGIFLFGTTEQAEAEMELKTVDYSNAALAPWSPNPFHFPYCNRTTNRRAPYIHPDNTWRGTVEITSQWEFESNRRFRAKAWSTNYVTHATSGFHTKLQRRRLGIWWASDADEISVSVRANVYFPYLLSDNELDGLYIPIKFDPWLYNNGYRPEFNDNKASVNFGLITAQVGLTNNLNTFISSGTLCDPTKDFGQNSGNFVNGSSKFCKPKWKAAKNVKIKDSESCHYVKRGSFEGEMQIKMKFNG
ncbi:hypothetical protein [Algoriphagus namhaensis]